MNTFKKIVYYIAKYTGFFHIAKILNKGKLRILCYHGFSFDDEHYFRPKLYMAPELFARRMALLKKSGFSVLGLQEATKRLAEGNLPPNTVVITLDDGWAGVEHFAAPILKEYSFPWTLYLTTYYVKNHVQVINMIIQYLFWKSECLNVDISSLNEKFIEDKKLDLNNLSDDVMQRVIVYAENLLDIYSRREFVRELGKILHVDVEKLESKNLFFLIDVQQAKLLLSEGVSLQLHTHRHRMAKLSRHAVEKEIIDNRAVMMGFCKGTPQHFCYPSGEYSNDHFEWLANMDIYTATTCDVGLNDSQTNPLALKRFLDGQNISQIEFEAELYGFAELFRKLKG